MVSPRAARHPPCDATGVAQTQSRKKMLLLFLTYMYVVDAIKTVFDRMALSSDVL